MAVSTRKSAQAAATSLPHAPPDAVLAASRYPSAPTVFHHAPFSLSVRTRPDENCRKPRGFSLPQAAAAGLTCLLPWAAFKFLDSPAPKQTARVRGRAPYNFLVPAGLSGRRSHGGSRLRQPAISRPYHCRAAPPFPLFPRWGGWGPQAPSGEGKAEAAPLLAAGGISPTRYRAPLAQESLRATERLKTRFWGVESLSTQK